MGDIRGAQQLAGIELDEGIGLVDATLIALHQEFINHYRVAVAVEAHPGHRSGLCHLLSLLLGSTSGQKDKHQE